MLGLVKYEKGPGNMEVRDVEEPQAGPGEVKIKVENTGICGSDLHIYHSDIDIPVNPPVVTGHEFAGTVVAVGEGVTSCGIGDRVTSETAYSYCGECDYCKSGYYNLCNQRRTLGYWYNGAFTSFTKVPEGRIHRLPDSVSFRAGAMLEPLACVTHAVTELTTIGRGDWVLVSGPGSIGLLTLQVAKAQGAKVIVAGTGVDERRLLVAENLGVDRTVDVTKESLADVVSELTNSKGVDVVLECAGNPHAVDAGLDVIRKRGQFTQIGLFGKSVTLNFEKICFKELKVTGSLGSIHSSWEKAIGLVAEGKVLTEPLISHVLPITEWEQAFELFEKKGGLKLLLEPVE